MPNGDLAYLNRRVAARSTIAQAQSIELSNGAVRHVDVAFRKWFKTFMKMPKGKPFEWYQVAAEKRLDKLDQLIHNVIGADLLKMAYWGWDVAYQILIDTLPVAYWEFLDRRRKLVEGGVSFAANKGAKKYDFYRRPKPKLVNSVLRAPPKDARDGLNWEERLTRLSGHTRDHQNVGKSLAASLVRGDNPIKAAKEILPQLNGYKAGAERIARTEMLRVSHEMQRANWEGFDEIIAGFRILATLDDKTRPHHAARHGDFYARENESGDLPDMARGWSDDRPIVPDEPNCRCHETPVITSMPGWVEDILTTDRIYASMDGPVEDPGTFANWFDGLGEQQQKKIVGPRRWRLADKRLPAHDAPLWADFLEPNDGMLVSMKKLEVETTHQFMTRRKLNMGRIQKQSAVHQREMVTRAGGGVPGPLVDVAPDIPGRVERQFLFGPQLPRGIGPQIHFAPSHLAGRLPTPPVPSPAEILRRQKVVLDFVDTKGIDYDRFTEFVFELEVDQPDYWHSLRSTNSVMDDFRDWLRDFDRFDEIKDLDAILKAPILPIKTPPPGTRTRKVRDLVVVGRKDIFMQDVVGLGVDPGSVEDYMFYLDDHTSGYWHKAKSTSVLRKDFMKWLEDNDYWEDLDILKDEPIFVTDRPKRGDTAAFLRAERRERERLARAHRAGDKFGPGPETEPPEILDLKKKFRQAADARGFHPSHVNAYIEAAEDAEGIDYWQTFLGGGDVRGVDNLLDDLDSWVTMSIDDGAIVANPPALIQRPSGGGRPDRGFASLDRTAAAAVPVDKTQAKLFLRRLGIVQEERAEGWFADFEVQLGMGKEAAQDVFGELGYELEQLDTREDARNFLKALLAKHFDDPPLARAFEAGLAFADDVRFGSGSDWVGRHMFEVFIEEKRHVLEAYAVRVRKGQNKAFGQQIVDVLYDAHEAGVNDSIVLELKDGRKILFKPIEGEMSGIRFSIPAGTYAEREVAGKHVVDALGWNHLVPETEIITVAGKKGAAVLWIDDAVGLANMSSNPQGFIAASNREHTVQSILFDWVIGNTDRHQGNYMSLPDFDVNKRRIGLIDHGLAFPDKPGDTILIDQYTRAISTGLIKSSDPLPREMIEMMALLGDEIETAMDRPGISRNAVTGMRYRLQRLEELKPDTWKEFTELLQEYNEDARMGIGDTWRQ